MKQTKNGNFAICPSELPARGSCYLVSSPGFASCPTLRDNDARPIVRRAPAREALGPRALANAEIRGILSALAQTSVYINMIRSFLVCFFFFFSFQAETRRKQPSRATMRRSHVYLCRKHKRQKRRENKCDDRSYDDRYVRSLAVYRSLVDSNGPILSAESKSLIALFRNSAPTPHSAEERGRGRKKGSP